MPMRRTAWYCLRTAPVLPQVCTYDTPQDAVHAVINQCGQNCCGKVVGTRRTTLPLWTRESTCVCLCSFNALVDPVHVSVYHTCCLAYACTLTCTLICTLVCTLICTLLDSKSHRHIVRTCIAAVPASCSLQSRPFLMVSDVVCMRPPSHYTCCTYVYFCAWPHYVA